MKSKFSTTWVASKQPRKQRKYLANAPNHLKRKLMSAPLDKPLKEKHKRRNIEVRKGDEVKVMRGKFKGKRGKVGVVDVKNTRIQVEGISRTKKGGEKVETWFSPSKVKIMVLDASDSKRMKKAKGEVIQPETKKEESKEKPKTPIKKAAQKKAETKK